MKKLIAVALLLVSVSACNSDNWKDVEGIKFQDARYFGFNNVDGHPNIVVVCLPGAKAYITVAREHTSIQRASDMDDLCKA